MSSNEEFDEEIIKQRLNAYLKRTFKGLEGFEVILKPVNSLELDDAYIQYLVDLVSLSLKPIGLNPVSNLCIAVMNFVEALGEKKIYNDLEAMLEGGKEDSTYKGVALPNIERALLINYASLMPVKKRWRFGKTNRIIFLNDLNAILVSRKKQILKYFNQVYLKHNIKAKLNLLEFNKDSTDGMPVISATKMMGI